MYREVILRIINSRQGIKATELVLVVMSEVGIVQLDHNEYNQCLESLVKDKEIVEIEYVLPQMNYRLKSFYLPKGTTINVRA